MSTLAYSRRPSPAWHIVTGGFLLATVDLVYVCSFWWLLRDVPPTRIMQFIASGALGKPAFDGGLATALAGVGFHYFIATMMVCTYYLAARRFRALLARPLALGLLYGVALWAAMNYVVVPLSRAEPSAHPLLLAQVTNFAVHLVFGVICVGAARRALGLR